MEILNYIFDFDGTLMDTQSLILQTIKDTIKDLGLPERSTEQCKKIIGIRTDEAGAVLYPEIKDINADFAKAFRRNYDELNKSIQIKPFEGVKETLQTLHDQGRPMAIASSRRRQSLLDYLKQNGMEDYFCMIVGADDVKKGKPDPEPVLKVLDAMHWPAEDTLVVGDADVDILMGNAAGCQTCAVTYGNGSLHDLQRAHPTFIVDYFDLILTLRDD